MEALLKFLILWIICQDIALTTDIALKKIAYEDSNTRLKRSPAPDNFSLFGFKLGSPLSVTNLYTGAKESLSGIGNMFSLNRGNIQNYHQPIEPQGIVKNNKYSPIDILSNSGMPNSMTEDGLQKDKNNGQEKNKYEMDIKSAAVTEQISDKSDTKTELLIVSERNDEAPGNETSNEDIEKEIDKNLLAYIFQMEPYDDDLTIDYTTETGDYENTTIDELLRIPAPVVASLLG